MQEKEVREYKKLYYLFRVEKGKNYLGRIECYVPFLNYGVKIPQPPKIKWVIKRVKDEVIKNKTRVIKKPKDYPFTIFTDREVKEFYSFKKSQLNQMHKNGR